jgi:hypothetical protein
MRQQHLYSASTIRSLARARHARCRMPVGPSVRCAARFGRSAAGRSRNCVGLRPCSRPPSILLPARCAHRCERRVRTRRAGRRPTRRSTTCTVGAALQLVRRAALQLAALQHAALQHAACRVRYNLSQPSGAPHRTLLLRPLRPRSHSAPCAPRADCHLLRWRRPSRAGVEQILENGTNRYFEVHLPCSRTNVYAKLASKHYVG